jgi:hypothetical protein
MIAIPSISTACAMSREAKTSSVQLLKAENVDRNRIISQHYKGKRLVIYYHIFVYERNVSEQLPNMVTIYIYATLACSMLPHVTQNLAQNLEFYLCLSYSSQT